MERKERGLVEERGVRGGGGGKGGLLFLAASPPPSLAAAGDERKKEGQTTSYEGEGGVRAKVRHFCYFFVSVSGCR